MRKEKQAMTFYAFRYCLGRMTYAVSNCVDYLIAHWLEFDDHTRSQIAKETKEAITKGQAGAAMDVEQWQKLLDHDNTTKG